MWLSDTQKIGVALSAFGVVLITLGIILMFDAGLIAIGNILFLLGVILIIGFQKSFVFFSRKEKIRGTICFFVGLALIFMKYSIWGMILESFGFINLFGNFFPVALGFLRRLPVIGKLLSMPGIRQVS
ncbi:Protein transport protein GOT1 [Smittium culicis]|uniref:Protein transport protein GOT1 n=2 Tax=Legeriomycetaceae TaxID=4883 RepID=A0A1R1X217_9FUNG|nr:Protein transport protein GOT1 [Smittium culicis]